MKTKKLLADSFRELVLTMPFQKISIKMITDKAGVIRPTFYNYFQDKYEVIEYLFDTDVKLHVQTLLDAGREPEAIKVMFVCFEKNMRYYKKLFALEGQNSFEDYFRKYIHDTYLQILNRHPIRQFPSPLITSEVLAHFNATIHIEMLKMWLNHTPPLSAEEMYQAYRIGIRTSILDMVDYPDLKE